MNRGKTIFTFPTHTLVTVPFLSCIWSVFYYCRKLIPCLPFFCLTMSTKCSGKLQPAFLYCSACPLVAVTIRGTEISLNNPKYPTISAFSGHILMRNRSKKHTSGRWNYPLVHRVVPVFIHLHSHSFIIFCHYKILNFTITTTKHYNHCWHYINYHYTNFHSLLYDWTFISPAARATS